MESKITRRYGIGEGAEVRPTQGHVSAESGAIASIRGLALQPNRGIPLNLDWVEEVRVNTSAAERRVQTLVTRRTVKKEWQLAWLLRAISCMDLTTLSGDDTDERVRRLCAKARQPIQQEIVRLLGIEGLKSSRRGGLRLPLVCGDGAAGAGGERDQGGGGIYRVSRLGCRLWMSGWRRFGGLWKPGRMRSM